jgi:anti-sigma-K factor RskA
MNNQNLQVPQDQPAAEAALVHSIRTELERSCAALDGETLSRLHRMRSEALAVRKSNWQGWWLPFATAAVLVLALSLLWPISQVPAEAPDLLLEDIEVLVAEEELEFYADYEFYQWLAME